MSESNGYPPYFRLKCSRLSIGHPDRKGSHKFRRGVEYMTESLQPNIIKRLDKITYHKQGEFHKAVEFYHESKHKTEEVINHG